MAEKTTTPDPFALWREWVSSSERQWNAYLNEMMATDEFTKSMGRFMDVYLNMQKQLNDTMGRYLTALNLPTRSDILGLGDRISTVEARLAAIETKLDSLTPAEAGQTAPSAASAVPRPPRTRKPPSSPN